MKVHPHKTPSSPDPTWVASMQPQAMQYCPGRRVLERPSITLPHRHQLPAPSTLKLPLFLGSVVIDLGRIPSEWVNPRVATGIRRSVQGELPQGREDVRS